MNEAARLAWKHVPDLTERQAEQLAVIAERLCRENEKYNLTALVTPEEIAMLHFYDALTLRETGLFNAARIIDVGCGGGFPALPLAVAFPGCAVTANDATAKKLAFVQETAAEAGIGNIETLCGRAEELGRMEEHRERYDVAVSRGVARLNVLCEWCLPLVAPGGCMVAMKGPQGRAECAEAAQAVRVLGGRLERVLDTEIPLFEHRHTLVVIQKAARTPAAYPRPNARIKKRPL